MHPLFSKCREPTIYRSAPASRAHPRGHPQLRATEAAAAYDGTKETHFTSVASFSARQISLS